MKTIKCMLLVLTTYLTFFSSFATAAKVDPKMKKCTPISQLNNSYTPDSLFIGMDSCIAKQNYDQAAEIFFLIIAYGHFDKGRINDPSVGGSFTKMVHDAGAQQTEEVQMKMQGAFVSLMEDKTRHQQLCNTLHQLGRPAYYPGYLIARGMRTINKIMQDNYRDDEDDEPIMNVQFDTEENWQDILAKVTYCPAVAR